MNTFCPIFINYDFGERLIIEIANIINSNLSDVVSGNILLKENELIELIYFKGDSC